MRKTRHLDHTAHGLKAASQPYRRCVGIATVAVLLATVVLAGILP